MTDLLVSLALWLFTGILGTSCQPRERMKGRDKLIVTPLRNCFRAHCSFRLAQISNLVFLNDRWLPWSERKKNARRTYRRDGQECEATKSQRVGGAQREHFLITTTGVGELESRRRYDSRFRFLNNDWHLESTNSTNPSRSSVTITLQNVLLLWGKFQSQENFPCKFM